MLGQATEGAVLDLENVLRDAIVKVADVPPEQVTRSVPLEALGIDSLAVAEILVELEIHLDRELPVDLLRRLDQVRTVGDVVDELAAVLLTPDP
jgi:acyl carrier protein